MLLHGVMGSAGMWREVVPLLAEHHDTIALTALGHVGGTAAEVRPARVEHIVDDAERRLDDMGLDRVHLAGNSMGGWVALELARRGRARSVCALSPGGTAPPGPAGEAAVRRTVRKLERLAADARRSRRLLPLVARSPSGRRYALRLNAQRGDRVTPAHLLEAADDVLGCGVGPDVLRTPERLARLDPLPCPVTIAWAEHDRVLPFAEYGRHARELVPGAELRILRGLGHVPMFDDPALVARTILAAAARATAAAG